jgi:HTH-type transcriptional regulator / antitoxin HigA
MMRTNRIQSEKEYKSICQDMDLILAKGTKMGDMDLLSNEDKTEYIRLSTMVREWEKTHYPHPIPVNPLIAQIQERMTERNLKQRETAILLGIDEARMSEILRGKKSIGMRLAKNLRKNLQINADIILDFA